MVPLTVALSTLLLLGLALLVGAFVQAAVGFGVKVVSGPVVLIVAPDLMPGALILAGMLLPAVQLAVKSFHVVWRPLGWNMLARALTTPVGVWLVLVTAPQQIGLVLGVVILLTVVLSVWSIDIRPTVPNSLVAGALSGISSPSAAAGGPVTALLFQHDSAQRMRSTLAGLLHPRLRHVGHRPRAGGSAHRCRCPRRSRVGTFHADRVCRVGASASSARRGRDAPRGPGLLCPRRRRHPGQGGRHVSDLSAD